MHLLRLPLLLALLCASICATCGPITYAGTDATLFVWQLRYRLTDRLGKLFYCDPDYYPIGRDDEAQLALERFPEIQADSAKFAAILEHLGWQGRTTFSSDDKLTIYRESKQLNAIMLEPAGDAYTFRISVNENTNKGTVTVVTGDIDVHGRIVVRKQEASIATCPICLPGTALIATPRGDVAVRDVKIGMLVWTTDAAGTRVAEPVLETRRVPVSAGHLLMRVRLSDGRELIASPGHPTADGRTLGELKIGDVVAGARVVVAEMFASRESATYDLLPAGPTGTYWAQGVLIGSTLHRIIRATSNRLR